MRWKGWKTYLVFCQNVIHKSPVVGLAVVDALDEVEVRVDDIPGTVNGDDGEEGEEEGEGIEVVDMR